MLQVWVWTLFFKFLNLTILNFGTPFQIQEFLGQVRISSLDNISSLDLSVVTKWAKLGITLKDLKNLILGQVRIPSLNTISSLDFSVVVKWAKLGINSKDLKNLILGQVRIPSLDTISSLDFSVVVKWAKLGITLKDLENLIIGQVWIPSLDTISSLDFNVVIKWAKFGITSRDLKFFISSRHNFMKNMSISFVWENLFGTLFFFVSCVLFSSRLLVLIKNWPFGVLYQ
jgi:hypothetical protein